MNVEKALIIMLLFIFFILLIPNIETAISGLTGTETLYPIFIAIPLLLIGSLFIGLIYFLGKGD